MKFDNFIKDEHNGGEIYALFPIPLYVKLVPVEFSVACNFFDSLPDRQKDKDSLTSYGAHSDDTYVLNNSEVKDLSNYIINEVKTYTKDILQWEENDWVFSQSWVSKKYPGQSHTTHSHPNSVVSGVLFYGNAAEQTSTLNFHKSMGLPPEPRISLKKVYGYTSPYTADTFTINFVPGTLCIFPSHLHHSVRPNNTNEVRKSIAFNVVPKGGLGDENSLTQLDYKKVL